MMKTSIATTCLTITLLTACQPAPSYQKIDGQTMGTSYHITFEAPKNVAISDIQNSIDERLAQINASMSTYDKNSTISKFNALPAGQTIQIDSDFIKVLDDSRMIYKKSHHAFDPTVYPLVELWGFGSSMNIERLQNPPTADQIHAVQDKIGLDKVVLSGDKLTKTNDGVGLDFSAIAKGYGVDAIADVLKSQYHIKNFMVEIGGEIATGGVNNKGKPWTLAIDKPIVGSTVSKREIMTTVLLSGQSMATSGNYRNRLEYDGQTYSHTISPITAHPVQNGFASISVISDTTAIADGWATALSAVPANKALQMANDNDIIAIFIGENNQKTLEIIYSQAYTNTFNPTNKTENRP